MLGQRVEHVVEEANARVEGDALRLAALRGVRVVGLEQAGICVGRECAAVNVEGELDLGLVGVAREGGPAGVDGGGHCLRRRAYSMVWYRMLQLSSLIFSGMS